MEEKVLLPKKLVDELLGAITAMSMIFGKNEYVDNLVQRIEEEMKSE